MSDTIPLKRPNLMETKTGWTIKHLIVADAAELNSLIGANAPDADSDKTKHFSVRSTITVKDTGKIYTCTNNAEGAAQWRDEAGAQLP